MDTIKDVNFKDRKIFLRVDWNVPLKDGVILDDNRIAATIPTIKFLCDQGCRVIIGTHVGRPDGEIVPSLSTKPLAVRFSKISQFSISASDYIIESRVQKYINQMEAGQILVLGNLRWQPEEESNTPAFARILASYADVYINDAFAVSHRAHASVEAITHFLPSCAGFLLEKEVRMLSILGENPRHPFVLVLGGAKIAEKIGLIRKFAQIADNIIVGGAIANTLRYFKGEDVCASTCELNCESIAKEIIENLKDKLILPIDDKKKKLSDGRFSFLDIGPESVKKFSQAIASAKAIFWNGNMGMSEDSNFQDGTAGIAKAIADNPGVTVVAGGDTVGFIRSIGLEDKYKFVSTGGGAALEFLAGEKLPGLEALGYYEDK